MGGDKNQIAESAAQALETYQHAKDEVEKIEKLAQVQGPHLNKKTLLILLKAFETHTSQSQRPLATVSTVHYSTGKSSILLSAK